MKDEKQQLPGPEPAPRPAGMWVRYREWKKGLDRTHRRRLRALQASVVLVAALCVGCVALDRWIEPPDLPRPPSGVEGSGSHSEGVYFEGADLPEVAYSGRREGVYTFLLAGRDVASGATDTMLLITYDTKAKTIHGLNLPRDTMLNVATNSKRLNAVFGYNRGKEQDTQARKGMEALKKQVARLTGILPDFYVLVEWEAVGRLVNAVGGVEFEVPFDMKYDDPFQDPPLHIDQKAGVRVLTGEDAMEVIRWRKNNDNSGHSGTDVERLAIQQDFLKAVARTCLQPNIFLKIPALAEIFKENVDTDLSVGNILGLAQLALGMDPDSGVRFSTAPISDAFRYKGADLLTLDGERLAKLLNDGWNPYLEEIRAEDLELVYRKTDGSFGVTRGALADPKMGEKPAPAPAPVEPDPQPDTPPETEQPPQQEQLPGYIDPGDVLPDPEQWKQEQDDAAQTRPGESVAVLPARPVPVRPVL